MAAAGAPSSSPEPSSEVKFRVLGAIGHVASSNASPWSFFRIAHGICSMLVPPPPAAIGKRRIQTDHDHYRNHIVPVVGGRELLLAVGFVPQGNELVYTSSDTTTLAWAADEFLTAAKRQMVPTTLASALATTAATTTTHRAALLPPITFGTRSPSNSISGTPLPPPPSFAQAMLIPSSGSPSAATSSHNSNTLPVPVVPARSSSGNGSLPASPQLRGGMEHSHSDTEWEMIDLPPAYEAPRGGYEAPVGQEHKHGTPVAVVPVVAAPVPAPVVMPPMPAVVIPGRRGSGAATPPTPIIFGNNSATPRASSPLPGARSGTVTLAAPATPVNTLPLHLPITPTRSGSGSVSFAASGGNASPRPSTPQPAAPTTDQLAQVEAMGFKVRTFIRAYEGAHGNFERAITRLMGMSAFFSVLTVINFPLTSLVSYSHTIRVLCTVCMCARCCRWCCGCCPWYWCEPDGLITEEPGDSAPYVAPITPVAAVPAVIVTPVAKKPLIGPVQPPTTPIAGGRPSTPTAGTPIAPAKVAPPRSDSPAFGIAPGGPGGPAGGAMPTGEHKSPAGNGGVDPVILAQIMDFGFTEDHARRALLRYDNNADRAINALLSGDIPATPSVPVVAVAVPLTASGHISSVQPGLLRGQSTDDIETVIRRLDAEEAAKKKAEDAESARLAEALTKEYSDNVERKKLALRADGLAVRALLESELKAGRPLKNEEFNFLYAPADHVEGKDYNCMSCYCDYKIDGILICECKHFMCMACIKQYFETQINNGRAKDIKCPQPECNRLVSFSEVKRGVDKPFFDKYQSFLLDAHLKLDPDCRWCPRAGCGTPMIGNRLHPMMRCPKESCKFAYCFSCKEAWHQDVTCEKYQAWKAENKDSESKYQAWQKANTKPCPKCKAAIEKNGGCNHMTCGGCRHQFCWLCAGEYKSGHFSAKGTPCNGKQFT